MEERGTLGLRADDPVADKKVCGALRARNTELIEDGLNNLSKALQLRPDYDDAMAYVNLLYRQKADTECDPAASMADLKTAQDWVDKTMAAKKAKSERQPSAPGITLDQPTNRCKNRPAQSQPCSQAIKLARKIPGVVVCPHLAWEETYHD